MLVINHLGLLPAWLIPTLLMSRYTTITHISFYKQNSGPRQLNTKHEKKHVSLVCNLS